MADTRSAVLNLRVKPELKDRLERDAEAEGLTASAVARRILAQHYASKPLR